MFTCRLAAASLSARCFHSTDWRSANSSLVPADASWAAVVSKEAANRRRSLLSRSSCASSSCEASTNLQLFEPEQLAT